MTQWKMAKSSRHEAAFSRFLAEENERTIASLRSEWRNCPATQHLPPQFQTTCSGCLGKTCARMQAKGLDDTGQPLPLAARPSCGAKTRAAHPCTPKVTPGKTRCRFHGGKSTGPRTLDGRARIAEAQRKRWAKWRQGQGEK